MPVLTEPIAAGDRVRVTSEWSRWLGRTGTVEHIAGDYAIVFFVTTGERVSFFTGDLERVW